MRKYMRICAAIECSNAEQSVWDGGGAWDVRFSEASKRFRSSSYSTEISRSSKRGKGFWIASWSLVKVGLVGEAEVS